MALILIIHKQSKPKPAIKVPNLILEHLLNPLLPRVSVKELDQLLISNPNSLDSKTFNIIKAFMVAEARESSNPTTVVGALIRKEGQRTILSTLKEPEVLIHPDLLNSTTAATRVNNRIISINLTTITISESESEG